MIDPHADEPVVHAGPPLTESRGAAIFVHGRNAAPRNILDLVPRIGRTDLACFAPAAAGQTWYPLSFLAERDKNEPYLSSALRRLERVVDEIIATGMPASRIALIGFSQGACLASEFVYRHPARYGGLVAFSGGLIGPPGTTWETPAALGGVPVFLGCSDVDAHVPKTRVDETAAVFQKMGADVVERIYPGMGHLVSDEEIEQAQAILNRM